MTESQASATVLFFAALREELGFPQLLLPLHKVLPASQLVPRLIELNPELATTLCGRELLLAVNQQLVGPDVLIRPGDEVALFPPVTGG